MNKGWNGRSRRGQDKWQKSERRQDLFTEGKLSARSKEDKRLNEK
jgi:hypothetical protein